MSDESNNGNDHFDELLDELLASVKDEEVGPKHQGLADFMRQECSELLRIQLPKSGDDLPVGAVEASIEPVALLRNIQWFLQKFDTAMRGGERSAEWEAVRAQFLDGEADVSLNFLYYFESFVEDVFYLSLPLAVVTMVREKLFAKEPRQAEDVTDGLMKKIDVKHFEKKIKEIVDYGGGRRHKHVLSEGSPLVMKVETFLMEKTKRNRINGSFKHPSVQKIVEYVNQCPELLQHKRKVLKGGNKRRLFTVRTLYSQLKADGYPLPVIKKRVEANYA